MAVLTPYSTILYRHAGEPANWTRKVRQVGWTAPTLKQVFPPPPPTSFGGAAMTLCCGCRWTRHLQFTKKSANGRWLADGDIRTSNPLGRCRTFFPCCSTTKFCGRVPISQTRNLDPIAVASSKSWCEGEGSQQNAEPASKRQSHHDPYNLRSSQWTETCTEAYKQKGKERKKKRKVDEGTEKEE